jgi:hypothetical protein
MRMDRFIRLVAVASLVVVAWPSAGARAAETATCYNVANSKCCYDCTTLERRACEGPNLCSLSPGRYEDEQ